jgi:UDP-N-acetylmuramyl pentapeptide phosphotransferase/UDP-N-acetylglucosamine-1-phosphate transferase
MSFLGIAVLATAAFIVSALLTRRFCSPDSVAHILDHPNERSLHDRPVPRGGGLAILATLLVCVPAIVFIRSVQGMVGLASGVMIVAVISFLDDRHSVPAFYRFVAHAIAAILIIYSGLFIQELEFLGKVSRWSYLVGAMFSVMFIVWMINLYNFMDGMDGFAGGMAVAGFGTFAILGWQAGNTEFMLMSLVTASAAGGFLIFNFPPARIFMGDVGSSTFGLLAAAFSLWGARENIFPFWIALLVFSPFIVDATVTLLRRLLRGEKIWQAHKSHYYQQLVQAGWGHRKTVLVEYGIMLGCGMTALWGLRASANVQAALIAGWAVFYFLFFFSVSRLVARREKTGTP